MPDVIERLEVAIEANIEPLLKGTEKGVREVQKELRKTGRTGEEAFDDIGDSARKAGKNVEDTGRKFKNFSASASALTGIIAGGFAAITTSVIQFGSQAISSIKGVISQGIEMNASFEQAEITFQNIFKDSTASDAFLENLRQTANDLKIPFAEAQQFAKSILPDTSSVEGFNDLLRLAAIGAKDANLPLRELIFSFNEAVAGDFVSIKDRLDIPRDVIARIKDADDTTAALTEELEKLFEKRGISNLEAFDDTLSGTTANMATFAQNLQMIAGEAGFDAMKDGAGRLLEVLEDNQPQLEAIAEAFGDLVGEAIDFVSSGLIDTIETIDTDAALELFDTFGRTLDTVGLLADQIGKIDLGDVADDATFLFEKLNQALLTLAQINTLVEAEAARGEAQTKALADRLRQLGEQEGREGIAGFGAAAVENVPLFASLFETVAGTFGGEQEQQDILDVQAAGQKAYEQTIRDSLATFDEYNQKQEDKIRSDKDSKDSTESLADGLALANDILAKNADGIGKAGEAQQELVRKFGIQLIEEQEKVNTELEALQSGHAEKMIEIDQAEKDKRSDINERFDDQLASGQERILSKARDDLLKLEQDTDRELADERKDFNQEEKRDTEDHLKDMRRIRQSFLDDLETIVGSRDAVALVNRRRQFERERSTEKESFETSSQRDRQDFDQELSEIRENEDRRSQEIINSREQAVEQLIQKNAEGRQRELERAAESFEMQRQKEQEQFDNTEQALNESLERRLEAIAISLANQGDVTEEGAQNVLGILSEHFGRGGLIDSLMDDFRGRVAELGTLEVEIQASLQSSSIGSGQGSPGAIPTAQRGIPFADGGAMIARPPGQLALVGEKVPEMFGAMPISQMEQAARNSQHTFDFQGSAPPGIMSTDRDQLASLLVTAMREAGFRS